MIGIALPATTVVGAIVAETVDIEAEASGEVGRGVPVGSLVFDIVVALGTAGTGSKRVIRSVLSRSGKVFVGEVARFAAPDERLPFFIEVVLDGGMALPLRLPLRS